MNKRQRYAGVIGWFKENVPVAESELHFENAFQLIIAVILSAQCTDKRVNMHTPEIFRRYPTPESLAAASFDEIYPLISSISFPNNKARHLLGMARMLVSDFGSQVPSEVEDLVKLPGVGLKTADVVASIIYDKPVIAVDTHVFRVSHRLGLSDGSTPEKVSHELEANIEAADRATAHHWFILHGRYVCTARNPKCDTCGLTPWCREFNRTKK